MEFLESSNEQTQSDLRLAFKRIADLQAIIEDELDSDVDDSDYRWASCSFVKINQTSFPDSLGLLGGSNTTFSIRCILVLHIIEI